MKSKIIKYAHRFLNPLPVDHLVSEMMTQNVVSISKNATIHDAWKLMLEQKVKALPVIDQDEKVIDIITNEELIERAGVQQRLSVAIRMDEADINQELRRLENTSQKVEAAMAHPAVTILGTESLGASTSRMVKAGLKNACQ